MLARNFGRPSAGLNPKLYLALRGLGLLTFRRYFRVQVEGLEYWQPETPMVICPKHQRWEDIPVIGLAFPQPLYFVAKVELFRQTLSRLILRTLGGIPLDRRCPQATLSTFRTIKNLLQQGQQLVLFPEGTYYPGTIGPGKHRLIRLLLRYQHQWSPNPLPFLPLGISYLPTRPGYEVKVIIGPPLRASRPEEARYLTQQLLQAIKNLLIQPSSP